MFQAVNLDSRGIFEDSGILIFGVHFVNEQFVQSTHVFFILGSMFNVFFIAVFMPEALVFPSLRIINKDIYPPIDFSWRPGHS